MNLHYNDQNFGTFETHFLIGETSEQAHFVSPGLHCQAQTELNDSTCAVYPAPYFPSLLSQPHSSHPIAIIGCTGRGDWTLPAFSSDTLHLPQIYTFQLLWDYVRVSKMSYFLRYQSVLMSY